MSNNSAQLLQFKSYAPLNRLPGEDLLALSEHAVIERKAPGATLFSLGDRDCHTYFLLAGQISLIDAHGQATSMHAGEAQSHQPVCPGHPRRATALSTSCVTLLTIDNNALQQSFSIRGISLEDDLPGDSDIAGIIEGLPVPILKSLPPPYLSILKQRTKSFEAKAGTKIVNEGDLASHYHLIAEGHGHLTRRMDNNGHNSSTLIESGKGFGEGALIEGHPHRHTLTLLEDSLILKVGKGAFLTLMVRPNLHWLNYQETQELREQTNATLLDVRSHRAFQMKHLPGSTNIPLQMLSQAAPILDSRRPYIICCESPQRSMTASFILAQHGISSQILQGAVRTYCQ